MTQPAKVVGALKENPDFLGSELITYIGNKRGLLPFIGEGVERVKAALKRPKLTFLDLFAGSGVVSRFMKSHASHIACNDSELYTSIINGCYLSNASEVDAKELWLTLAELTDKIANEPREGFIAELYAPRDDDNVQPGERVFYTRRNAEYIDTARQHIAELPLALQKFFLGPLLVEASIHNNTGGVFKGFYKNRKGIGAFGGEGANALSRIRGAITLRLPTLSRFECDVRICQQDALQLSSQDKTVYDLVYLDPPYNQHPYGSNYFMLNLIASYERPTAISKVSGIPSTWTRSPFNTTHGARDALFATVRALNARYFLISYNSEGFITKDEFIEGLQRFGTLTMLETEYNTYRASRNLMNRKQYVTEYLFLLKKTKAFE